MLNVWMLLHWNLKPDTGYCYFITYRQKRAGNAGLFYKTALFVI